MSDIQKMLIYSNSSLNLEYTIYVDTYNLTYNHHQPHSTFNKSFFICRQEKQLNSVGVLANQSR